MPAGYDLSGQAKEAVEGRELAQAQSSVGQITFYERIEASPEHAEDLDTARLVTRIQAGDRDAFSGLYTRYFDRVYGYMRVFLNDRHEAEDAAQQVFIKVMEALPRYEHRKEPFRGWLFVIVRNYSISQVKKQGRTDVVEPGVMADRGQAEVPPDLDLQMLGWISDNDLTLFVERLPLVQRQVLLLRFMLDLPFEEIGRILDRAPEDVRQIQSRALVFLRQRLAAVGRTPRGPGRRTGLVARTRQAYVLRRRRYALQA